MPALLFVLGFFIVSSPDEMAVDETLLRTLNSVKDIRSGSFRFDLLENLSPADKQATTMSLDSVATRLRAAGMSEEDIRQNLEGFERSLNNTERRFSFFVAIENAAIGGDRFVEFDRVNGIDGSEELHLQFVQRKGGRGGPPVTFVYHDAVRSAFAKSVVAYGAEDIENTGRLDRSLTRYAEHETSDLVVKNITAMDAGISVMKLEVQHDAQVMESWEIHINPSKGYITPLVERRDRLGRTILKTRSEQYFEIAEGVWFPSESESVTTIYPGDDSSDGECRTTNIIFDMQNTFANVEIPRSRFTLSIPASTTFIDNRQQSEVYEFISDTVVTIDDLEGADFSSLVKLQVVSGRGPQVVSDPATGGWTIFVIGIGNVAGILVTWWYVRRRRMEAATLLMVGICSAILAGCNTSGDSPPPVSSIASSDSERSATAPRPRSQFEFTLSCLTLGKQLVPCT